MKSVESRSHLAGTQSNNEKAPAARFRPRGPPLLVGIAHSFCKRDFLPYPERSARRLEGRVAVRLGARAHRRAFRKVVDVTRYLLFVLGLIAPASDERVRRDGPEVTDRGPCVEHLRPPCGLSLA